VRTTDGSGSDGGHRIEVTFDAATAPAVEDAIEHRPTGARALWSNNRSQVLVGVALIVAVVIGYLLGSNRQRSSGSSSASPSASSASSALSATSGSPSRNPPTLVSSAVLAQTGGICGIQVGNQLQLGVEIENRSAATVTLAQVDAVFPLNGLRTSRTSVGVCGGVSPQRQIAGASLAPGSSIWLSMIVDVLVSCPTALPVQFRVTFDSVGRAGTVLIGAFPDLGDVAYSGCDAES